MVRGRGRSRAGFPGDTTGANPHTRPVSPPAGWIAHEVSLSDLAAAATLDPWQSAEESPPPPPPPPRSRAYAEVIKEFLESDDEDNDAEMQEAVHALTRHDQPCQPPPAAVPEAKAGAEGDEVEPAAPLAPPPPPPPCYQLLPLPCLLLLLLLLY